MEQSFADTMASARCSGCAHAAASDRSLAIDSPRRHRHGPVAGAVRQGQRPASAARALRRRTGPRRRRVALPAAALPIHHQRRAVRQPGGVLMTLDVSRWSPGPPAGRAGPSPKGFARHGYSVAACDRRAEELVARSASLGDDAGDRDRVRRDLPPSSGDGGRKAVDRFGSLTTLVNNAGMLHRASLADETIEDFENAWRVNCLGVFLGMRRPSGSCARRSTQPSSTSAAPERSAPSRSTAPTARRSGRFGV